MHKSCNAKIFFDRWLVWHVRRKYVTLKRVHLLVAANGNYDLSLQIPFFLLLCTGTFLRWPFCARVESFSHLQFQSNNLNFQILGAILQIIYGIVKMCTFLLCKLKSSSRCLVSVLVHSDVFEVKNWSHFQLRYLRFILFQNLIMFVWSIFNENIHFIFNFSYQKQISNL